MPLDSRLRGNDVVWRGEGVVVEHEPSCFNVTGCAVCGRMPGVSLLCIKKRRGELAAFYLPEIPRENRVIPA